MSVRVPCGLFAEEVSAVLWCLQNDSQKLNDPVLKRITLEIYSHEGTSLLLCLPTQKRAELFVGPKKNNSNTARS